MKKSIFILFCVCVLLLSVFGVSGYYARVTGAATYGGNLYIKNAEHDATFREAVVTVVNIDTIPREVVVYVYFYDANNNPVSSSSNTISLPAQIYSKESFIEPNSPWSYFDVELYDITGGVNTYIDGDNGVQNTGTVTGTSTTPTTSKADISVTSWTKNLVASSPNQLVDFEITLKNKGPDDARVKLSYQLYDENYYTNQIIYSSGEATFALIAGTSTKYYGNFNPSQIGLTPGTYYLAIGVEPESAIDPDLSNNYYFGYDWGGTYSTALVVDSSLKLTVNGATQSVNSKSITPNTQTKIIPPPRPTIQTQTAFSFNFEGDNFYLMNKEFFEGVLTGSVKLNPESATCLSNNLNGWSAQYYDPNSGKWGFTPTSYDDAIFIYVKNGYECTLTGTIDSSLFTSGWDPQSIPSDEYIPSGISYNWLDSNGGTLRQTVKECNTGNEPKEVFVWDETVQNWVSLLNENLDPTISAVIVTLGVVLYC